MQKIYRWNVSKAGIICTHGKLGIVESAKIAVAGRFFTLQPAVEKAREIAGNGENDRFVGEKKRFGREKRYAAGPGIVDGFECLFTMLRARDTHCSIVADSAGIRHWKRRTFYGIRFTVEVGNSAFHISERNHQETTHLFMIFWET